MPIQESNPTTFETDPRFPSGAWKGFWIQRGMGKQRMLLCLEFRNGQIVGEGGDIVGPFTFKGQYDLKTGRCKLTKQYLFAHSVTYDGVSEGDDLWLWGLWQINTDRGGFHLWPEGKNDPTQKRVRRKMVLPNRQSKQRVPSDLLSL